MDFNKINFQIESHNTIHIFKNYFCYSIFSFQFLVISSIQTDPRGCVLENMPENGF